MSAFGPYEVYLVPKGGAKSYCFNESDAIFPKETGVFQVAPSNPTYDVTYDWSGWGDLTKLDSAYAMICATLDEAYDEFRTNIPVTRESVDLEEDCTPYNI